MLHRREHTTSNDNVSNSKDNEKTSKDNSKDKEKMSKDNSKDNVKISKDKSEITSHERHRRHRHRL